MLKNFFKTAGRNILKYQAYSAINFVGLICGFTLALLILAYVRSEVNYDRFQAKADRLYRLAYTAPNGLLLASTPPPIAPVLKEYHPEIEEAARLYVRNVSISKPDSNEAFEEPGIVFADSAIMNMMSFEFVKGSPGRALVDKFTILINEEMATKYFGTNDPMGETLLLSGGRSFTVTGVVKNFPESSHLRFSMLVPYDDMYELEDAQTEEVLRTNLAHNFVISHSYTYALLKEGTSIEPVNARMGDFVKKYADPRLQVGQVFAFMPLLDIHLKSTLMAEPSPTNSWSTIYIFIGVGLLTLLIASINYVNLSTAQALSRIKEIGIRKVLGSQRSQLIIQFLTESFLFTLVSMIVAYLMFQLTLPALNVLTNKHLTFIQVVDFPLVLSSITLILLITLLAGGYPAYFVSRFESISAIKGAGPGFGRQVLRKSLVVIQLAIACLLLSGALIIVKQLNFLENRPLGFQKDQIITIPLYSQNLNGFFRQGDSTFQSRLQAFRYQIERESGVQSTALSSGSPGLGAIYRGTIPEGFTREDNMFVANMAIDYDFLNAYDIALVAGRTFSRDNQADPVSSFLVNETAVREFKWESPDQALGKTINREGKEGKVVGVISDFNFTALTTPVSALVMDYSPTQFTDLTVRFDNENIQATLDKLQTQWNQLFPEKAFEFTFLDEQLNQQYDNFQNFGYIIQVFTVIAMLIACLGVYGLVLFSVKRKVKEIGVRKVLGAKVESILILIFKDFILLIVIGFALAIPVSYYLANEWLQNFIYRTSIDWLTYAISLITVLIIVTATISYQALQAAQANPVNSLRTE